MNNSKGTIASTGTSRKFTNLNEAAQTLEGVKSHLKELHVHIGISQPEEQKTAVAGCLVNQTLISTLEELPSDIFRNVEIINSMISDVMEALN